MKLSEKKKKEVVERLKREYGRTLFHCYKTPSTKKLKAWETIIYEMYQNDGCGLTVLSYNSQMFTCAYTYCDRTGKILVSYHTPNYNTVFELQENIDKSIRY